MLCVHTYLAFFACVSRKTTVAIAGQTYLGSNLGEILCDFICEITKQIHLWLNMVFVSHIHGLSEIYGSNFHLFCTLNQYATEKFTKSFETSIHILYSSLCAVVNAL